MVTIHHRWRKRSSWSQYNTDGGRGLAGHNTTQMEERSSWSRYNTDGGRGLGGHNTSQMEEEV